jgi:SAM-dependent methyltransferase
MPGTALDLGCGTGAQARYLAERGWHVTAVDYLAEVVARAARQDPAGRVTWRTADVTDPCQVDPAGRLAGLVDLILDNGCLHGIGEAGRPGWARTVVRVAAPEAILLVRAADRRSGACRHAPGPAGISRDELVALLSPKWRADPCAEPGWYRFRYQRPT